MAYRETTDVRASGTIATERARTPTRFRADIQGLRAIAVVGVLLFHLWPNRMPGGFAGVDVFFVISGFLITTHLIQKPPRRAADFLQFWARRVRRLLPASFLVLGATALAAFLLAPISTWKETGKEIVASALYVQNWTLAASSVDYLAADNSPTPVQHFWSLSVEEQYYLVWPVVISLVVYFAVRKRLRWRWLLAVVIVAIIAASFAYNIWLMFNEPALAYFVTPARMWELAIGALIAVLFSARAASTSHLSALVAWIGLAGLALSYLVISPEDPFPGYIALLPILSTALIIAANSESVYSPTRWLSLRPAQFVGDASYSIYLWHWPMVVLAPFVFGPLGRVEKIGIIVSVIPLSWVTMKLVEQRFRVSTVLHGNTRTYGVALLGMALVVTGGAVVFGVADHRQHQTEADIAEMFDSGASCLGAMSLVQRQSDPAACPRPTELVLDPLAAESDKSRAYDDGCWTWRPYTGDRTCVYGSGDTQIALVGNSHAGHWLPALLELMDERDWTITTYLVDRCNPSAAPQAFDTEEKIEGCLSYGEWVLEETTSGKFDAVITSERQSLPVVGHSFDTSAEAAEEGYVPFLQAWHDAGLSVLVIRDTPFPGATVSTIPECVAQYGAYASRCEGTPDSWAWMDPLAQAARDLNLPDQYVIDPTDWICPEGVCRAAIGGVITYFDGSHLTATYARSLSPLLSAEIDEFDDAVFDGA